MAAAAVDLIVVPWDSGRRGWRMGAGPGALLAAGLPSTLRSWGHDTRVLMVEPADTAAHAQHITFSIARAVAARVADSARLGRVPIVLGGNCFATVGAVAGTGAEPAVVWLDAHGDLNTPASTTTGFLDGMAAATLLGWCHEDEATSIPGFRATPPHRFLLVGARAFDDAEVLALQLHALHLLTPEAAADEGALAQMLDDVVAPAGAVWLHIDLDVFDPAAVAPANPFDAPGGLTLYQVIRVAQEVAARARLAGITLSAYDPAVDPDARIRAAVLPLLSEALLPAADGAA